MQDNRGTLVQVERLRARERERERERSAGDTRARLSHGEHDMGKTSLGL